MRLPTPLLLLALSLAACQDFRECAAIPAERLGQLPERLSQTGLFTDAAETLADGVRPYEPQFALWSDGAHKRRWIWLPPGSRIDTSDMDFWQFPEGTKVWKEFTRDGVRVETRLLQKVGPGRDDWAPMAYVWSDDQRDAVATPAGLQNAKGTAHDVPSSSDCMGCHGGTPSHVLGFSAIQLGYDAQPGLTDLQDLIDAGLLTAPPAAIPRVPGNDLERQALGYIHANCSHCHNQSRPQTDGPRCYDPEKKFEFLLRVSQLGSPQATSLYRTGIPAGEVKPGKPDDSDIIGNMKANRMPPLGHKLVDEEHLAMLRQWISAQ